MESVDWVAERIDGITDLTRGVMVLGAVVMVAVAYHRTRSIVAMLVAGLVAGVLLWMVNNPDWFQGKVEEERGTGAYPSHELTASDATTNSSSVVASSSVGLGYP